MTNFDKWKAYTDGSPSPDNYLDWSWRFVISSALQRRCWYGADHEPLFPNMYIILVGKAGIGKGRAITPATDLLKFHKKKDFIPTSNQHTEQDKLIIEKVEQANLEDAEASMIKVKRAAEKVDPPLFPYAPDATTYEALVEAMSNSGRRINYPDVDKEGKPRLGIYYHCSMYFSLPELGSLFRKRTDDVVNYLLGLYDCPIDYEYRTKTKGNDRVRRGCLNILAGTTPEFMATVFDENLINQGFSSRTFFIYAGRNRKNIAFPPPLTEEQIGYRQDLLIHIKKLAGLYGNVIVDKGTRQWIEDWWDEHETNRSIRSNASPKLDPYYGRKQIHMVKTAMANHFGETTDMKMEQWEFEKAATDLADEEKNMHMALTFDGDNPLGKLTDKVTQYLGVKREANIVDLKQEFWKMMPSKSSLDEVLEHLIGQGIVEQDASEPDVAGRVTVVYRLIK